MAIDPYRFGASRHFKVAYLDVTEAQRSEYKKLMYKYMYDCRGHVRTEEDKDYNPIFEETIAVMKSITGKDLYDN